jgi:tight adherence protein B
VRAVLRRAQRQRAAASRASGLDDLCALAADLRAGLPPAIAAMASDPLGSGPADARLAELTAAVWRLGERTGAPAADLIERIEADGRAGDRAKATAAAEAAGAQATAMLLAALPLGGIALGYSIGADPLQVLLHTKLGAACAIGAVVLQSAGLLWCDRLVAGPAAR